MSAETPGAARTVSPLDLVRRLDPRVIVPVALLVFIGLLSIGEARPSLVAPQLRWCAAGFAVTCMVMLVPYRRLLDLAWPLWGASVAMLLAVLVLGDLRNGARRWLQFGPMGLQPSEFAKVAQIVVMARYIRFRRDHRTFKGLFVPFLITLVPVSLILAEPDLGTAAMFVPPLFVMLWAAGARTKHLLVVVGLAVAAAPVLYFALPEGHYQRGRVDAFVASITGRKAKKTEDGAAARVHDTFQRDEAVAAVAWGGVAGRSVGPDEAAQHERVPESWTDFVFVVHAEEWGFAGVLALLAVWTALLAGLASLAAELKEPAARLLCIGALVLLGTQALINMAMTMGVFPVTGVPLPFVSYGGSSMLASWLMVAVVLHAKARQPVVFSVGDFD